MKAEPIDLDFTGAREVTASFLLLGGSSAALVETGPSTFLENLIRGLRERGVSPRDVQQVFLTHVHLEHAGAAGHLAGLLPNAVFYVHVIGYRHLVDPTKLGEGATRVYGERMDELWGEVRPVPEDRLVALSGSEEAGAADGVLVAHHTPGHARHHLAYHELESKTLFDPQAWARSIALIRRLEPRNLAPTHFGTFEDVDRHLDELEWRLRDWLLFVEQRVDAERTKDEITDELRARADAGLLVEGARPGVAERYELAGSMGVFVDGLLRYFERPPV
jgi:glyoxylase-like metal-dependent hydrolase (beta-lactamase superfamily II)